MYVFVCLLILKFDLRLRILFFILSDFSVQGTEQKIKEEKTGTQETHKGHPRIQKR